MPFKIFLNDPSYIAQNDHYRQSTARFYNFKIPQNSTHKHPHDKASKKHFSIQKLIIWKANETMDISYVCVLNRRQEIKN